MSDTYIHRVQLSKNNKNCQVTETYNKHNITTSMIALYKCHTFNGNKWNFMEAWSEIPNLYLKGIVSRYKA